MHVRDGNYLILFIYLFFLGGGGGGGGRGGEWGEAGGICFNFNEVCKEIKTGEFLCFGIFL